MLDIDFRQYLNALADKAFDSKNTKGRRKKEDDDSSDFIFDPFLVDKGNILRSKALRRLGSKAQVFCTPDNLHVRTRLSHTLEVVDIATQIAMILGLNVPLCEAIAFGHDIGHSPYGHQGERVLSRILGEEFRHEKNGIFIAQHIEREGKGLNLSFEVLEGILNHSKGKGSLSVEEGLPLEYLAVMFADKIAYTFADINDAERYGYIREEDLPAEVFEFGNNQRERVLNSIFHLVKESVECQNISFLKSDMAKKFEKIRQWMYENVCKKANDNFQESTLERIYEFFNKHDCFVDCEPAVLLSLMTDEEVLRMSKLFLCSKKIEVTDLGFLSLMEIIPYIKGKEMDFINPDLDWGNNRS